MLQFDQFHWVDYDKSNDFLQFIEISLSKDNKFDLKVIPGTRGHWTVNHTIIVPKVLLTFYLINCLKTLDTFIELWSIGVQTIQPIISIYRRNNFLIPEVILLLNYFIKIVQSNYPCFKLLHKYHKNSTTTV